MSSTGEDTWNLSILKLTKLLIFWHTERKTRYKERICHLSMLGCALVVFQGDVDLVIVLLHKEMGERAFDEGPSPSIVEKFWNAQKRSWCSLRLSVSVWPGVGYMSAWWQNLAWSEMMYALWSSNFHKVSKWDDVWNFMSQKAEIFYVLGEALNCTFSSTRKC